MAKITIEELFYGDKYGVMGEVVKQVFARQDEFVADPHTFRELEIVRQTLIAVEKMKKKGDCIDEEQLGDSVTFLYVGGTMRMIKELWYGNVSPFEQCTRGDKQMKDVQMWLGHTDIGTIANIYSHLDAVSKADTGAAMSKALG